jgi:heme exporter protein C
MGYLVGLGDARLNLTAILLLVYLGYLASRKFTDDLGKTSRNSAFIGIFGIIQLPILHFSVIWWRSVHQQASILSQEAVSTGSAPMSSDILTTLLISVLLVTLLHFSLLKRFKIAADTLWNDYLNPKNRVKI